MALVKSSALVLRSYRLGETSKVLVCYTRDHGKVRLVAKGVRKGGGRLGAALEPLMVSGVVFYMRPGRDRLSLVSQAHIEREFPALRRDLVRMAYASAVLELVDDLVVEGQSDAALFDLMERSLEAAASVSADGLDRVLWLFELSLAKLLGYEPKFDRCVVCGREREPASAFSAQLGGVVCEGCLAQRPDVDVTRGEAFDALADVAGASANGGEGGPAEILSEEGTDAARPPLSASTRDEVGRTLRTFLSACTGHAVRLKSAEFLRQVRRAELAERGSRETDDAE
jgi:DNA repair protein RecO (recombination protein O)